MANTSNDKWYFTKEQLENTPSRKCGYDSHKELSYRQQAANFIQDMGQRLKVSQLCINTAIVYMHRFYVFHSFTHFPWHQMAAAALFLAAKVEEQPRKLEYVIRVANICRNSRDTNIDINSERYISQSQDLVFNENVLLQTLGFDVAIDHPHTHVVRCCHLVRASKDLAQTSYFMASNSLHLTTMCIQYKPTVVACFCILVACKWSNWEIPLSNEKKEWYSYVDPTVTAELLKQLTEEFLVIFEACPSRLKEKIMAIAENVAHIPSMHLNSPFDTDPKKIVRKEEDRDHQHRSGLDTDPHKHRSSRPHDVGTSSQQQQQQQQRDRNRDRMSSAHQQKPPPLPTGGQPKLPHGHHRSSIDPKLKTASSHSTSRPPSMGGYQPRVVEPRDILREAPISPFGIAGANKDHIGGGHAKDKRDHLPKTDANSYAADAPPRLSHKVGRMDATTKVPSSATAIRSRHDEHKQPHIKSEPDTIKKQLNATAHDKSNNAYLTKPPPSTSQKVKSPYCGGDQLKSVPKLVAPPPKPYHHNGGSYSAIVNSDIKAAVVVKSEPVEVKVKEEVPTPAVIKRPSLFSPEKTPPSQKKPLITETTTTSLLLSPLTSPVIEDAVKRSRNCSSSSEPELRPVMKKIDQVEGFENLMRDNTIGINRKGQQPHDVPTTTVVKTEPVDLIPEAVVAQNINKSVVVNGLETNPAMISHLLKEVSSVAHLKVATATDTQQVVASMQQVGVDHHRQGEEEKQNSGHHHKSKKKNKEKHKHKDKSRDDKKKKHKDKDRERSRNKESSQQVVAPPQANEHIKIKIQRDKIVTTESSSSSSSTAATSSTSSSSSSQQPQGLKIKIPKNKINPENISELALPPPPPMPSVGIKLKIPKEKLSNCPTSVDNGGRKRERERTSPSDTPPTKLVKPNKDYKTNNGRHSNSSKVAQMGDGDASMHRLVESKYTHKNSSTS